MATKPPKKPAKAGTPKPNAPSADGAMFVEPSFRAYQPWNPQLLLGAELLCDGGTLRAAADLVEQMLGDDRLFAIVHKLVDGMLGLDVTFEAAQTKGKGRAKKSPVKALEAGEDWWDMFPSSELGEVLIWGTILGVGLGQLPWKPKPRTPRVIATLEAWSPRHLTWNWDARVWKLRVDAPGTGQEIVMTPGDGTWMLFTPYGKKRPWSKAPWRGLSRWWLLKQYALYDWGKYSEKRGQGVYVANPLPGIASGREDRKQLAADLKTMAGAGTIAMPPGYTLDMVECVANTYQTFKAQVDMANMAFAITLLGNNLSTEVTGGSFAAADVHQVVEVTKLRSLGEATAEFTHDQGLCWWAEFNFGSADDAPWAQYATEPPEDLKSAAELMAAFGTGLESFARFKIPVDVEAMCERFKIPLRAGVAVPEVLELPPPPPNPFGAPPGGDGDDDEGGGGDDGGGDDPPPAPTPPKKGAGKALRTKASKRPSVGQTYADQVAAKALERAHAALKTHADTIRDCVEKATSFEDLRKRLTANLRGMNPKALAKILHDATMLSALAGRASAASGSNP